MQVLITGLCGFVGSVLAREVRRFREGVQVCGIDNLSRKGSETNLEPLRAEGIDARVGDVRSKADLAQFEKVDWLIDAAANPSVLAGVDGKTSSHELLDHNLVGTIPMLEFCRERNIPFTLLSTSRVYSIQALRAISLEVSHRAFRPLTSDLRSLTSGASAFSSQHFSISQEGIPESFPTDPPLSLYGTSKRCAELLALEYGNAFGFPVWINRCGVMAGAGQFGKPDQGIYSYWIHSWARRRPLKYLGFGGTGHQVRDCLHPRDLIPLLFRQFDFGTPDLGLPPSDLRPPTSDLRPPTPDLRPPPSDLRPPTPDLRPLTPDLRPLTPDLRPLTPDLRPLTPDLRIFNVSGGSASALSLAQLSDWCADRFGSHEVVADGTERPFDLPWVVLDHSQATATWDWAPAIPASQVLEEIAHHAEQNPHWLELST